MMDYGYENEQGDRISALIDMINGGGAGRSGDTFEGGGILSLIANAAARPYGSVRERPGHSRMGAGAAPMGGAGERPMVADPLEGFGGEPPARGMIPSKQAVAPPPASLEGAGEETARPFTEADFSALDRAPPQLAQLFAGVPVGAPLTPREAMILDALRASASFNPAVNPPRRPTPLTRFTAEDVNVLSDFPDRYFDTGHPLVTLRDLVPGDPLTMEQRALIDRAPSLP